MTRVARKHPAPEGALRLTATEAVLTLVLGQKAPSTRRLFTGLAVRWLPTAPENGQSDRQSLEQALRADPNTPPPRAPSSSTTTKASTPGGFVPGELPGFQQASRSQNAYTAGTGQQTQSQETAPRSPAARSSPTRGTQSTRRRTNIHVPHQHCFSGDAEAGP